MYPKPPRPEKPLPEKRVRFVEEYCKHLGKRKAAIAAGYSPKTAHSIASEMLQDPRVQKAINLKLRRHGMRAPEAIRRMGDFARASIEPFLVVNEDTLELTIDLSSEEAQDALHLIKKIKQTDTVLRGPTKDSPDELVKRVWEVELHNSMEAVDKILRLHGQYRDNVDLNIGAKDWDPAHGDPKEYVKQKLTFTVER